MKLMEINFEIWTIYIRMGNYMQFLHRAKKKIVWLPFTNRPYFTARPKLFFSEKFFFSQKYAKLTEKYKKNPML